jgi:glycosyltransferase-like protein
VNPRVALVTYSIRPRGGVVHTLSVAEALRDLGADVTIVAMGDPSVGFYRPTDVPHVIVPAPEPADTLDERVDRSVDTVAAALASLTSRFDLLHTQDCISARAAARVRDAGAGLPVLRTVHHVDDFTTSKLIDCQRQAILEPDRVLVVSRYWQGLLWDDYGVKADLVHNGVDADRFAQPPAPGVVDRLRRSVGAGDRFVFLAIGGFEPRKGTVHLIAALGELARRPGVRPLLVVVGGHSFQDYYSYRDDALASLPAMGLELGRDVVLAGTVADDELHAWYYAADALAFPSLKEGWGLVVLEAMAAGLPVVAADIPVLREYLTPGRDALLVPPGESGPLAAAMGELMGDEGLRHRLAAAGREVAGRFTWKDAARRHLEIYEEAIGG